MNDVTIILGTDAANDNSIPNERFCYACREREAVTGALCIDCARDVEADIDERRGEWDGERF